MRLWPFLKLAIPLGTLAALALAYGIQRMVEEVETPINIKRPPPTTFAKLVPPLHGHPLAGAVRDASGAALEGALVWVRSGDEPSFTYTDAQGAFRFADLGAGPWPAIVLALGFEPLELTLSESAAPPAIALKRAYGAPPTLAPLESAPLAGRIVVPEGFDASRFEIVLLPQQPTRLDSALPRRVESNSQGEFAIQDLILAPYRLLVLPAWARGGTWPDLLLAVGGSAEHAFTHRAGATELVLQLDFGAIEGTLLEPITHGPDGEALAQVREVPVEGAVVELSLAEDSGRVFIPQSTDAKGRFVLRPLPTGKYLLVLHAGAGTLRQELELGRNETRRLELRLRPGG